MSRPHVHPPIILGQIPTGKPCTKHRTKSAKSKANNNLFIINLDEHITIYEYRNLLFQSKLIKIHMISFISKSVVKIFQVVNSFMREAPAAEVGELEDAGAALAGPRDQLWGVDLLEPLSHQRLPEQLQKGLQGLQNSQFLCHKTDELMKSC